MFLCEIFVCITLGLRMWPSRASGSFSALKVASIDCKCNFPTTLHVIVYKLKLPIKFLDGAHQHESIPYRPAQATLVFSIFNRQITYHHSIYSWSNSQVLKSTICDDAQRAQEYKEMTSDGSPNMPSALSVLTDTCSAVTLHKCMLLKSADSHFRSRFRGPLFWISACCCYNYISSGYDIDGNCLCYTWGHFAMALSLLICVLEYASIFRAWDERCNLLMII